MAEHVHAMTRRLGRCFVLTAVLVIAACAHQESTHAPVVETPAPHPTRIPKTVVTDAQNRERARDELQKATVASNEYSACVMFATSARRGKEENIESIADTASDRCAAKLDEYESSMRSYYELNPDKPTSLSGARERARNDRLALTQTSRQSVIRSLEKNP